MRLRIGPKLALSFLSVNVAFLIFSRIVMTNIGDTQRTLDKMGRTLYPSIQLTTQLLLELEETQSAFSEAVDDIDSGALEHALNRADRFDRFLEILRGIAPGPKLALIDRSHKRYIQLGEKTVTRFLETENLNEVMGDFAELGTTATRLNTEVGDYQKATEKALAQNLNEVGLLARRLRDAFYMLSDAVLIFGLGIAWFITRSIVHPLSKLRDATHKIGKGQLDVKIDIHSQDEIGDLAQAFRKMGRDLAKTTVSRDDLLKEVEERKKTEGRLKDTQIQLIQAEKMESVGGLAAGIAHEVKNPLTILDVGLTYLNKHIAPDDKDMGGALKEMGIAIKRADSIIQGLLKFSASQQIELEPENINEAVEEALLLVKHDIDRHHISLVKDLAIDLPPVPIDKAKIIQVFINLLTNACHAMSEEGTLTVRTYRRTVDKHIARDTGYRQDDRVRVGQSVVIAEISDTGPGIPPDKLQKIYDPFFSTKPAGKGTGLGLTVSRKIMEIHDGVLDIRNRPEGGVCARGLFLLR